MFATITLLLLARLMQVVLSHSWVERINVIASDEEVVVSPAGYARGNGSAKSCKYRVIIQAD